MDTVTNDQTGSETVDSVEGDVTQEPNQEAVEELSYEEALAKLQEERELRKKHEANLKQQEEFIQRQKNEVGKSREAQRKYAETLSELEKARAELERLRNDPATDMDAYAEAKHKVNMTEKEAQQYSSSIAETQVMGMFPDFEEMLSKEIPEIMKAEGYNEVQIAQMRQNWRLDPSFSIQYGHKVRMYRENLALKMDLEKYKSKSQSEAEQIANASRIAPPMRGSIGATVKPVSSMTQAEKLAEYDKLVKLGKVTPR